jgi:hypothetical protein
VLYDPLVDKDRDGSLRVLLEVVQKTDPERVKGKSKGKEMLLRFGGETVEGEPEPAPRDPRKDSNAKRLPCLRSQRTEYVEVKYEVCFNFFVL